jgi:hypothetical protein
VFVRSLKLGGVGEYGGMTGALRRPRSIDLGMCSCRHGAEACEWTSVIYAIANPGGGSSPWNVHDVC